MSTRPSVFMKFFRVPVVFPPPVSRAMPDAQSFMSQLVPITATTSAVATALAMTVTSSAVTPIGRPGRRPYRRSRPGVRSRLVIALVVCLAAGVGGMIGCRDLGGTPALPAGTANPAALQTPAGAKQAYQGVVLTFPGFYLDAAFWGGLLTDELQVSNLGGSPLAYQGTTGLGDFTIDARQLPEYADQASFNAVRRRIAQNNEAYPGLYGELQRVRGTAAQAIGLLHTYLPADSALRGHLYALAGYAELELADLFCSGVPLSTLDYGGDFTYHAGSTTPQVYQHAVALFDTAIALSGDSARVLNLARVGKGRALLALGQYPEAAQAVAAVPDAFTYQVMIDWSAPLPNGYLEGVVQASVADREGGNGLPYRSSGDPRTAAHQVDVNSFGMPVYFPDKYGSPTATSPLTVASGVEARLIEAEAALQAGDAGGMLTILNTLRTTGTAMTLPADTIADTLGVSGCGPGSVCGTTESTDPSAGQPAGGFPVPSGYSAVGSYTIHPVSPELSQYCFNYSWYLPCYGPDSTTTVYLYVRPAREQWSPGTGGVADLAPLADPGSAAARADLLFAERAAWLFLSGTRQEDLRRLVREYHRNASTVYPSGPYPAVFETYGGDVNFPIPTEERTNPHFNGCLSRGA